MDMDNAAKSSIRADLSANMTRTQIAEAQKLSRELAD